MGKFPVADKALTNVLICKKCKARNPKSAKICRKCMYPNLRVKKARKKDAKGGK
ncbi:50S ribosomal protein L40e [Candidatus Micrarchaeota archaeon]|nr:50S ribosomal protein L40e [Candidatus Micrarchaeota archaeon]